MSLLTLLVLFVRFDNVLVDPSYDMAGNRCERLPVVWQVPFQLSPFEPTSFGSLPEILGWIQEVSQPRLRKKTGENILSPEYRRATPPDSSPQPLGGACLLLITMSPLNFKSILNPITM